MGAVAHPEITIPICSTRQLFAPVAAPTWTDHFHPGSYEARPMVIPPNVTSSNLPFSNTRTSSGCVNLFRITSSIVLVPSKLTEALMPGLCSGLNLGQYEL